MNFWLDYICIFVCDPFLRCSWNCSWQQGPITILTLTTSISPTPREGVGVSQFSFGWRGRGKGQTPLANEDFSGPHFKRRGMTHFPAYGNTAARASRETHKCKYFLALIRILMTNIHLIKDEIINPGSVLNETTPAPHSISHPTGRLILSPLSPTAIRIWAVQLW